MINAIKLFISYSRQDDEAFAERLYHDLTTYSNFDVWWDREKMRNRGQTFLQEIRDAIFNTDFLILIVGPHAKNSDYVCDEWQHGLQYSKTVIPILRIGLDTGNDSDDFALVPEPLRNLHCYDFRSDERYSSELIRLTRDISEGPLQLGMLLGVPALPPHYLPRSEDLQAIHDYVLADVNSPTVITSEKSMLTLQGMGGIGKTVIAAAFARTGATRRVFTDGILWVTVGQRADMRALYEHVGTLLGDSPQNYRSEESGKANIQRLLAKKTCLLILDDVWHVKHAEPFRDIVAGTRIRLLMTTRKLDVSRELDAQEYRVTLLTSEQAVSLLRNWAGRDDSNFVAVANRLECLPLALKIAGGRLRRGMSSIEWLERYDRVSRMHTSRRAVAREDSLEISIELGVDAVLENDDEKLLYYTFGIFQEDTAIPQNVVVRLWRQIVTRYDEFECLQIIDDLVDMALIERHDDQTITLHDLLHDYTREKLGNRTQQTHNDLLSAYNPDTQPWYLIPHDGYLHIHLAYHLCEALRRDELHMLLLAAPNWMETKFVTCVGDTAYASDLDLAISYFEDPLNPEQLLTLAQLYTARQVVHERVSAYNDTDLQTLVWLGREQEALSHARLRSEAQARFTGLLAVYDAHHQREHFYPELLDEALRVVYSIQGDDNRAFALSALAITLAEAGRFSEARNIVDNISPKWSRAKALRGLATALAHKDVSQAEAVFIEAEAVTNSLHAEEARVSALSALAAEIAQVKDMIPHALDWIQALFDTAQNIAHSIQSPVEKAFALSILAANLAQAKKTQAEQTFVEARKVSLSIQSEEKQAIALRDLVTALAQAQLFREAQEIAYSIQDEGIRTDALSTLATALAKQGYFDQAKQIAYSIESKWRRADALRALAAALAKISDVRTEDIFKESQNVIRSIQSQRRWGAALRDLVTALAYGEQFDRAQAIASTIQDSWSRAETLRDLGFILTQVDHRWAGNIFDEARDVACGIQDEWRRSEALRSLASITAKVGFPQAEKLFSDAQTVTQTIQYQSSREEALRDLAIALAQAGYFDRAEEMTSLIQEQLIRRSEALHGVATALAQAGRFERAQNVIHSIRDEIIQSEAMRDLVIALAQAGFFDKAQAVARNIQLEVSRTFALRSLAIELANAVDAPHNRQKLAEKIFSEAHDVACTIQDDWSQAVALRALVAALAEAGYFDKARLIAYSIPSTVSRVAALNALATALANTTDTTPDIQMFAEEVFSEVKDAALNIENSDAQALALSALAVALAYANKFDEAYKVACSIQVAGRREVALGVLAATLAHEHRFNEAFHVLGRPELDDFVQSISSWAKPINMIRPKLSADLLCEVVRIVGWIRVDWYTVFELLSDLSQAHEV